MKMLIGRIVLLIYKVLYAIKKNENVDRAYRIEKLRILDTGMSIKYNFLSLDLFSCAYSEKSIKKMIYVL